MWIKSELLENIEIKLNNHVDDFTKLLIYYYLIEHNYYYLLNNVSLKKIYYLLEEVNLNDLIEIFWFFNKEIDISTGWEELENKFKKIYPNISTLILNYKKETLRYPIMDKKNYIKYNSLI